MKKYLSTVLVLAIFALGFSASDYLEGFKVAEEKVPEYLELVNVSQMLSDLNENEMRAQKKYAGKWFEIVGTLGGMDSEGEYFSLEGGLFGLLSVHCKIPKTKRTELTNILADMSKGDRIAVKGKITDMGEIMGYDVTVVEIYHKPKGGEDSIEKIVGDFKEVVNSAISEIEEEMKESKNDYVAQVIDRDYPYEETRMDDFSLSERKLKESDLQGKTKKELELMRNEIYARHGYRFKRDDLFNHFSQFSWYNPQTSDMSTAYSLMNRIEKYNIEFIKRYE